MHGHAFAEGGDSFGELVGGFFAELGDPVFEGVARGVIEADDFVVGDSAGEEQRAEASAVEDFVGVGVADTAEEVRVREGTLQSVILFAECFGEGFEGAIEGFDAVALERVEGCLGISEVEGGAALGSGFGEEESAVGEIEGQ